MNPQTPRPSVLAARLGLIFTVLALAGLFLLPYGTLSRNGDAQALLARFPGGLINFRNADLQGLPDISLSITLSWVTVLALLATAYAAFRRASWLWMAGLVTLLSSVAAAFLFRHALTEAAQTLLAQGTRARRIPWLTGGVHLGLFLPMLAGAVSTLAGLSARAWWWNQLNRLRGLLVPLSALLLAIAIGAAVVMMVQQVPTDLHRPLSLGELLSGKIDLVWYVYTALFAPVTNLPGLFDALKLATPLIFTGLGVAFAFRAGLFNIGGPGQLTVGAIAAMLVGVYAPLPPALLMPATILAAAAGGALWGAIPGLLKARFGSSEVINTIMLNYIASAIFVFLIGTDKFSLLGKSYHLPFKAEGYEAKSAEFQPGARLTSMAQLMTYTQGGQTFCSMGPVFGLLTFAALYFGLRNVRQRLLIAAVAGVAAAAATWKAIGIKVDDNFIQSHLNTSFVLALACAALFAFVMWRTATGYALRAVGLSPAAAEYGGINVAQKTVLAMAISGALIGLGATHYTMGGALDEYRLKGNMPANVGFDGISVALMGQSTPAGVVASALLFGTVDTGSVAVNTTLDNVNKDIVTVLKALIVLFIAAGGFLSRRITDPPPAALLEHTHTAGALPNVGASAASPESHLAHPHNPPTTGVQPSASAPDKATDNAPQEHK